MTATSGAAGPLSWATVVRPLPGEIVSGDRALVLATPGGATVAVIDGLGHGRSAALAASEAVKVIEATCDRGVEACLSACHAALRTTRGAAIALLRITAGTLEWSGVGNVEAVLVHARPTTRPRSRLVASDGIVGHAMPRLRVARQDLGAGDVLVLATDGIRAEGLDDLGLLGTPQGVADGILRTHARPTDDALVFVARFRAGEASQKLRGGTA